MSKNKKDMLMSLLGYEDQFYSHHLPTGYTLRGNLLTSQIGNKNYNNEILIFKLKSEETV